MAATRKGGKRGAVGVYSSALDKFPECRRLHLARGLRLEIGKRGAGLSRRYQGGKEEKSVPLLMLPDAVPDTI